MTELITDKCPCCGTRGLNPKKIKDMCENCLESSFDQWRRKVASLEKENEELKKENEEIINALEKTKCCQMCKYLEDNGSCLRADKDEVNKWGDFLIGTRRKNHCKYWELAE